MQARKLQLVLLCSNISLISHM